MTKKKSDNEFMNNLIKAIGLFILRKLNNWNEKHDKKKKFNKQVKSNIKKNQQYAKIKNTKRYSLTKEGDIY